MGAIHQRHTRITHPTTFCRKVVEPTTFTKAQATTFLNTYQNLHPYTYTKMFGRRNEEIIIENYGRRNDSTVIIEEHRHGYGRNDERIIIEEHHGRRGGETIVIEEHGRRGGETIIIDQGRGHHGHRHHHHHRHHRHNSGDREIIIEHDRYGGRRDTVVIEEHRRRW